VSIANLYLTGALSSCGVQRGPLLAGRDQAAWLP